MTLVTRWWRFSLIGLFGAAVQLSVLALLLRAGCHVLAATTVAVEAAVLHNFWWHQVWTWRDRSRGSAGRLAHRLLAFHMMNGAVSLIGNVAVVALLVHTAGLHPLVASALAIAVCSAVNFAGCEWRIFARTAATGAVCAAGAALAASALLAAEPARLQQDVAAAGPPNPETAQAWHTYVQQVRARHDAAAADARPFFALDAYGVDGWRTAVMAGQVPAYEFDRAQPRAAEVRVPDGAIHHWTGAIFVPGLTTADALARVRRLAGQEAPYYDDVLESRLLEAGDRTARVYMKLQRSKVVTVTYNTEHAIEYRQLGSRRAAVRSVATRLAQLTHAGTPRERELPPGEDSGYLWRLNAYWRYDEIDTGVLIECESVSLSRSVPVLLRPFLSGVVDGLARESLERTLVGLRRALTATPP